MSKHILHFIILFVAVLFLPQCLFVSENVTVRASLPVVVLVDDPELVIIPGTYVYYVSNIDHDLFFYGGYWWRPWQNTWYRAEVHSGPWIVIEQRYVPEPVWRLPPRWHEMRDDTPRVKWSEAKNHWQEWERDKYWEKHSWKNEDANKGKKQK
jgi:hypothetical protein